ncbi:MAG: wax ester/triacylglycerol synthase domain-containing protein [Alphaproteobacteria bacterium]
MSPDRARSPEDELARWRAVGEEEHPLHVGSLRVFDAIPRVDEIERRVAARVAADARLSEPPARSPIAAALRLDTTPSDRRASRVERVTLPRPSDEAALAQAIGEAWSRPLPFDRRWQLVLLDGLPRGGALLLAKAHLSLFDEAGGIDLLDLLLGRGGEGTTAVVPEVVTVREAGGDAPARRGGLGEIVAAARGALDLLTPEVARERAMEAALWFESAMRVVASPAPETPLNGSLGRGRRIAWARLCRDVVRGIEESVGASTGEVVLAVVGDALGRHLARRGRSTSNLDLDVLVRTCSDRDRGTIVPLPVAGRSLRERTRAIRRSRHEPAARERRERLDRVLDAALSLPAPARSAAANLAWQSVNTVCIEARDSALDQVGGLRPRLVVPVAPLPWNVGLAVAWHDAGHEIVIGLAVDTRLVPDPEAIATALRAAATEAAAEAGVPAVDPLQRPDLAALG